MQIEREVDIRRRVAEVFNRREDEFEDLQSWNDYLEMVEGLTYDLIFGEAKAQTAAQKKLNAYKEANAPSIKQNATREKDQIAMIEAKGKQDKDVARAHRLAARKEDEDEVKAKAERERRVVDGLASGTGDAQRIVRQEEKDARKKAAASRRTKMGQAGVDRDPAMNGTDAFVLRGLKKPEAPAKEIPYDPFGGLELKRNYYTLQDHYSWDWLNKARNDVKISAGGYDTASYAQRALCDAFSGLGVFVGDDDNASVVDVHTSSADPSILAPNAASHGSNPKDEYDVF